MWMESAESRLPAPDLATGPLRNPGPGECAVCGFSPAIPIRVQQQIGLGFLRWTVEVTGWRCRDCGREAVRLLASRTLITGWWGIISMFLNLASLVEAFTTWRRLRSLLPPMQRDPRVVVRQTSPAPAGRSMWLRPGALAFVVLVGILGVQGTFLVGAATQARYLELVGQCLRYGRDGWIDDVVGCADGHDGQVADVTRRVEDCPSTAEAYFTIEDTGGPFFLCVEE
jgi:hypothetical protein